MRYTWLSRLIMLIITVWVLTGLPAFQVVQSAPQDVSNDARCGARFDLSCNGAFGSCCSQHGWCGSSNDHCVAGCQPRWGTCTPGTHNIVSSASAVVSSAPTPSSSYAVPLSRNARCGRINNAWPKGQICEGSVFGDCCSKHGY